MSGPTPGRSEIDLRVDIDERGPNSPVMGRVSADVYQVSRFAPPGRGADGRAHLPRGADLRRA